ncbi:MAG: GNAT family N-acetyltransferase [Firmicutes bacterium]|nr:GNAT family N-acetyltransferase [Bacillota bacterium]
MKINIIRDLDKLLMYKKEWNLLLKENDNNIAFLELDWIKLWWSFFNDSHKMLVYVFKKDEKVIGFAPLMETDKSYYKIINFIGHKEASYMDLLCLNGYRKEIIERLIKELRDIKGRYIINLHGFSINSSNYKLLTKYLKEKEISTYITGGDCFYIYTKNKDYDEYIKKRFKSSTRQTMRRKERRLKRLGNLSFESFKDIHIDQIFKIHDKRWKRKVGNKSFSEGKTEEFFKQLANKNNFTFNTTIDVLCLNDKVISFIYGFTTRNRYTFYRIAHDDDFSIFSPGEIVLKKKLEKCLENDIEYFDFGIGYEPYKVKWSDSKVNIKSVTFPTKGIFSKGVYIKKIIRNKVRKYLKSNKVLYNFKKYKLGKIKYKFTKENLYNLYLKIKKNLREKELIKLNDNYMLYEKDLHDINYNKTSDIIVRIADVEDLELIKDITLERKKEIVRKLARKDICFIAQKGNEIIHYTWISTRNILKIPKSNEKININKKEVSIYESYTNKNYNTLNNNKSILQAILMILKKNGFTRCYKMENVKKNTFDSKTISDEFTIIDANKLM